MENIEQRPPKTSSDTASARAGLELAKKIWATRGSDAVIRMSYAGTVRDAKPTVVEVRRKKPLERVQTALDRLAADWRARLGRRA